MRWEWDFWHYSEFRRNCFNKIISDMCSLVCIDIAALHCGTVLRHLSACRRCWRPGWAALRYTRSTPRTPAGASETSSPPDGTEHTLQSQHNNQHIHSSTKQSRALPLSPRAGTATGASRGDLWPRSSRPRTAWSGPALQTEGIDVYTKKSSQEVALFLLKHRSRGQKTPDMMKTQLLCKTHQILHVSVTLRS